MNADSNQCDLDYHLTKDSTSAGAGRNERTSEILMDQQMPLDETSSPDQERTAPAGGSTDGPGHNGTASTPSGAGKGRMGQIPPKYYRIGELVEYAGVSRQTIHNYATMGLLQEAQWTKGGHRLFGQEAFERLAVIAEMKAQNRSMQDIREHFRKLDDTKSLDSA